MRRIKQEPRRASTAARLIDILDRELTRAHAKNDFLTGKVERLELAMATFSNAPSKAYVDRSDSLGKPPITEVPVEQSGARKTWKQTQQEWAAMSDEEKQKVIDGKAN